MDEKIEEMAKAIEYAINNDCKLNNGKSCGDCIFDNNGDWNCQNILVATHLFGENYRKERDTAREILTDIITGFVFSWKADNEDYRNGYCQALTDYDEKIKSYIKEKYGVDLGE